MPSTINIHCLTFCAEGMAKLDLKYTTILLILLSNTYSWGIYYTLSKGSWWIHLWVMVWRALEWQSDSWRKQATQRTFKINIQD